MKAIENSHYLNKILSNKNITLNVIELKDICKKGNGKDTCRYIFLSKNGFCCVKNTKIKEDIDNMVIRGEIVSSGDNCNGKK